MSWFEAVVIGVEKPKTQFWWRDFECYRVAVHYIGWKDKWDEWIVGKSQCISRIQKRNSNTELSQYIRKTINNCSYVYS